MTWQGQLTVNGNDFQQVDSGPMGRPKPCLGPSVSAECEGRHTARLGIGHAGGKDDSDLRPTPWASCVRFSQSFTRLLKTAFGPVFAMADTSPDPSSSDDESALSFRLVCASSSPSMPVVFLSRISVRVRIRVREACTIEKLVNRSIYVIMGNEEANEIALLALRQVGCDLPEDCSGIEAFTTDTLVRLRVPCAERLLLAVPDETLPRLAFTH